MAMHVRTEGDKSVFSSAKFEPFAHLVWVKAAYHHYHSFENLWQKLEKHHVNGSQTRIVILLLPILVSRGKDFGS